MSTVRDDLVAMIDRALGDDPKAALIAARALPGEVDWLVRRAVALARREGYDWGRIGRLLGMSRQGARQKFPAAPPAQRPSAVARDRARREQRAAERVVEEFRAGGLGAQPGGDDPVGW